MNPHHRRWMGFLAGALLLGAASPALSQSFPSLADETDPLAFLDEEEEAPELPSFDQFGIGVKYDRILDSFTKTRMFWGDFRFNDSPRVTAYVSRRVSKATYVSLSVGMRETEIEIVDREPYNDLKLGDLKQYPVMLNFMFQGIQPFIGSGRTSDEITVVPFGSVGFGLYYQTFKKNEVATAPLTNKNLIGLRGLPPNQDLDVQSYAPAAEGQVGLEVRYAFLAIGGYIGHYWAIPKIGHSPYSDDEHVNMHSFLGGGYLEVRF